MIERILIKKLFPDVLDPVYATDGSAGFDLVIHNFKLFYPSSPNPLPYPEKITTDLEQLLPPHSRILIGCGFCLEIPIDTQLEIRSRSGVALKHGLIVLNSPGTIDSDYRGEIGAILCNTSSWPVRINKGDNIAQAVLTNFLRARFTEVDSLSDTKRGEGGFGSTDTKHQANQNY